MQIDKNYYQLLNVEAHATQAEIDKQYEQLRQSLTETNQAEVSYQIKALQDAYAVIGNPEQRRVYDRLRASLGLNRPSTIEVERILSHEVLGTNLPEQAMYVLLNIKPTADLPTSRLPLNLCLVLDRSTSMQGMRLQQVKQATYQIMDQLEPEDALSIVVFSDRAQVIWPSQKNIDKAKAKSAVSTVQPGGGTELLQGLMAGLKELVGTRSRNSVNHLILLTDGQTYGDEEGCIKNAKLAGHHQISLTTMGLGSDWNEKLLDQMAASSGGSSVYIDSPMKVVNIFRDTVRELSTVVARELGLKIQSAEGVHIAEAFQTMPHLHRLDLDEEKVALGPLSGAQGKKILLELRIPVQTKAEQKHLARITINSDIPPRFNGRNWELVDIFSDFAADIEAKPDIPNQIFTTLRNLALFRVQEKAMLDLENGEVQTATRRLNRLATQLLNLGERDLARTTQLEAGRLAHTGRLSKAGKKKIHYGTRMLSLESDENESDENPEP